MKIPKIDYKRLMMETAGEAAGVFALGAVSKLEFVAKQKPIVKGLIYKALGNIVLPMLAGKAKKGNDLINGAANAMSVAGTSQLLNVVTKGKTPAIGAYETSPINGPGYEFEERVDGPNDYELVED